MLKQSPTGNRQHNSPDQRNIQQIPNLYPAGAGACYLNAGLLVNNPACWGFTDEYKQNNRLSQIKYKIKFWSSISFLLNFSSFYGSFRQMIPRILGIYDTVTEGRRYYFYSKNYLLNSGRNKSGNISIHSMNFRFEMTIIIDHW